MVIQNAADMFDDLADAVENINNVYTKQVALIEILRFIIISNINFR